MESLVGKRALVTGGTSGIGLAVARSFVESDATVFISGRRPNGDEIAGSIGAHCLRGDASEEEDVIRVLDLAATDGKLDVVVINAGIAEDEGSVETVSSESVRRIFEVNLFGAFLMLKYAPSRMNDNGSIICTGSVAGSGLTHAGTGAYAASKAGIAYLARSSAIELAERGIRVNCVCPAMIAGTGMMTEDDGGEESQFLGALTSMNRMGRLDEVVGAYKFLASDGASFITGQEIRVDGGASAGIGMPVFRALSGEVA